MQFPSAVLTLFVASANVAAGEEFRSDQVRLYESDGGRNIPNYRFDAKHTAGGGYQITDTLWAKYAPLRGISLADYPNAMSADEKLQGQVAGLIWHYEGYMPWACCNAKLRKALAGTAMASAPVPAPSIRPAETRASTEATAPVNPFLRPARAMPEMVFNTERR